MPPIRTQEQLRQLARTAFNSIPNDLVCIAIVANPGTQTNAIASNAPTQRALIDALREIADSLEDPHIVTAERRQ